AARFRYRCRCGAYPGQPYIATSPAGVHIAATRLRARSAYNIIAAFGSRVYSIDIIFIIAAVAALPEQLPVAAAQLNNPGIVRAAMEIGDIASVSKGRS